MTTHTAPPARPAMRLVVLSPADRDSWQKWPVLVARMRDTLPALDPDLPVDHIIGFLCQQSIQVPTAVRWWLAVEEERVLGHAVAWVDVSWGQPYILVHHAVAESGVGPVLADWLADLRRWADGLNARYAETGSPLRLRDVRFWTARADAPWDRLLGNLVSKTFHVKHIPLERLSP